MVKSFREIKEINTKTKRDLEALCEDLVSNKGHIALLFKYRVFLDVLNFGITLSQIYFLDWVLGEFSILSPDQQRLNRMSFLKFGCGLIEYAIFGKWGQLGLNTPPGASLFPRRSKCESCYHRKKASCSNMFHLCCSQATLSWLDPEVDFVESSSCASFS